MRKIINDTLTLSLIVYFTYMIVYNISIINPETQGTEFMTLDNIVVYLSDQATQGEFFQLCKKLYHLDADRIRIINHDVIKVLWVLERYGIGADELYFVINLYVTFK